MHISENASRDFLAVLVSDNNKILERSKQAIDEYNKLRLNGDGSVSPASKAESARVKLSSPVLIPKPLAKAGEESKEDSGDAEEDSSEHDGDEGKANNQSPEKKIKQ